jgi:lysyl-tRNA synthetase class I
LRGARDLNEARSTVEAILRPSDTLSLGAEARPTLARFRELRERADGRVDYDAAKSLVRELKAVGGDLKTLRRALTGRDKGPELAAVVAALDRDETLRRLDAAL